MPRETKTPEQRATDPASIEILEKAAREGLVTCFARADSQASTCSFGKNGVCCRICHMGPCRITTRSPLGVCGADADTIVARNLLREIAAGTAAHSDHARQLALLLKRAAEGRGDYVITDEAALRRAARAYEIEEAGRTSQDVAADVADRFLGEFTSQEQSLATLRLAPLKQQAAWRKEGVEPRGIDRMIVESLHRSTMGVDHDYRHILDHGFRTALADGWGGSRIAMIASDILFGTPWPVRSQANLGVLGERTVNIIVHGHEPAVSEMLAAASRDAEMQRAARDVGAEGVTLAGICCTANEILMRHGISVAGNFLQQELAVMTGAVELLITDVQCCMPSLPEVARAYHTEIVSTSHTAKTIGAVHVEFDAQNAYRAAKDLIRRAIANFQRRDPGKVMIPSHKKPLVAGFSVEAIRYMLGGSFRASFRPLNDAIIAGRIHGVVGIVGCSNPRIQMDRYTNVLTNLLVERNVLVLKTGCSAVASAKAGMLTPEAAIAKAGPGLREVCEAVGIPPVLHMGSCVDNARLLEAASEIVREGGLGDDIAGLPVVGVAPEWMSEKAVAIGHYFVASGVDVVLGHPFAVSGSENVTRFLNEETRARFGASFHVAPEPREACERIIELLSEARKKLGIMKKAERKLMDMADRRALANV